MKFRRSKSEGLSPNHTRKLSEVLFEFAEEIAPRKSEEDILRHAIATAVLLWNIPLLPEEEQMESVVKARRALGIASRPLLEVEFSRLLDLRRTRYARDRRVVFEYRLVFAETGPRLTVTSVDLDRPEHRGG